MSVAQPRHGFIEGWQVGDDGWGPSTNTFIRETDHLLNPWVKAIVASLPASPGNGDAYILTTDNTYNVFSGTSWYKYQNLRAKFVLNTADNQIYAFNGTQYISTNATISTFVNPVSFNAPATLNAFATFNDDAKFNKNILLSRENNSTLTGSGQEITDTEKIHYLFSNAGLTSIQSIASTKDEAFLIITNRKASGDLILKNLTGTASKQIETGTGKDLTLKVGASAFLVRDAANSKWLVVGGTGGGGDAYVPAGQSLADGGTVSVSTVELNQILKIEGATTPVTLDVMGFGPAATYLNGTRVMLIGNSDDNSVTIQSNDVVGGLVGNFISIELAKYEVAQFVYHADLQRWVGGKLYA